MIPRIRVGAGSVATTTTTFFGIARGAGTAGLAVEEGTVGGEAGGEDADVEFDHCPDVYGDVGPWGDIVSFGIGIVCLWWRGKACGVVYLQLGSEWESSWMTIAR